MQQPLVTLAIPAHRPRFFHEALVSALAQTCTRMEVLVCDDSDTDEIQRIVEHYQASSPVPLRYVRNPGTLGFRGNLLRCLDEARGTYLKVLCDDDVLMVECVEDQLNLFEAHPSVTLVGSKRHFADVDGNLLPERLENCTFTEHSVLMTGADLLNFFQKTGINFIGGLSIVMLRTEQARMFLPVLTNDADGFVACLDYALYLCLLRLGDLAVLNRLQGMERLHPGRLSKQPEVASRRDEELRRTVSMLDARGEKSPMPWEEVRIVELDEDGIAGERKKLSLSHVLAVAQHSLRNRVGSTTEDLGELYREWQGTRQLSPVQVDQVRDRLAAWPRLPVIIPVIVDDRGDAQALALTLQSIVDQSYGARAVMVLSPSYREVVTSGNVLYAPLDTDWPRQVTSIVSGLSSCEWFHLLRAGDRLTPYALLMMAERIIERPQMRVCYGDEGALVRENDQWIGCNPVLRPDFNLDLLRSYPYVGRMLAFQRDTLLEMSGFDAAFGELAPHDLLWRIFERQGARAIEHIAHILCETTRSFAEWASEQEVARQAAPLLEAHLSRLGVAHELLPSKVSLVNQVTYRHTSLPLVSILIEASHELAPLQACVEHLMERTGYAHYEVLLYARSDESAQTLAWLEGVQQLGNERLRVFLAEDDSPAVRRNLVASQAHGDYLMMLDVHCRPEGQGWLEGMLNHAQREEVGITGCRVLKTNGKVVHAGIVLGLGGTVGSPFKDALGKTPGYMHRQQVVQNYSAVSGICMMVRTRLFQALDGFDSDRYLNRHYDVDLCLRARQQGYLTVWTPHVQLIWDEVDDVARAKLEIRSQSSHDRLHDSMAFFKAWLPTIARDPAYNPNLSLNHSGFTLEPGVRNDWQPFTRNQVLNVLALASNNTAVGQYRIVQPFDALARQGLICGRIAMETPSLVACERALHDVVIWQRRYSRSALADLKSMKNCSRMYRIYELDDYLLSLPSKNPHAKEIGEDVAVRLQYALDHCDRLVVSTRPLAEAMSSMHGNIRVVPNMLSPEPWKTLRQRSRRRMANKPRIGWGGGTSHRGDLEVIADVVRELADEVEWVFFGMCPDALRPYVHEFHKVVQMEFYPQKLASLDLDLALAPLEFHIFNDCKSNLRLLEYGACGYPVICSDTGAYRDELPATRVATNSTEEWLAAIRWHLDNPDASQAMGDALHRAVMEDYVLEGKNLAKWYTGWAPD